MRGMIVAVSGFDEAHSVADGLVFACFEAAELVAAAASEVVVAEEFATMLSVSCGWSNVVADAVVEGLEADGMMTQ